MGEQLAQKRLRAVYHPAMVATAEAYEDLVRRLVSFIDTLLLPPTLMARSSAIPGFQMRHSWA